MTGSAASARGSRANAGFVPAKASRHVHIICAVLACVASTARAQGPDDQLAPWAMQQWRILAKEQRLTLSPRVNPFAWRGDFDGDGRSDLAILVKHTPSGKEGIVLLLRSRKPLLLGAGRDFGNGGDDFSWLDAWHVEDRGTRYRASGGSALRLAADGLVVGKVGAASALIHLENGEARWRQQGD